MKIRGEVFSQLEDIKKTTVGSCLVCDSVGYLEPEVPGEINPCECMTVFRYIMALVLAKIPIDYWALSLDDLRIDINYKKFVKHYISNLSGAKARGLGIIFFGTNGIGKTSMMCMVGKAAVEQQIPVQYFTVQQYVDAKKSDSPLIGEFESGKLILLDEMDKVYIKQNSSFVPKTVEEFLRRMLSTNKMIIACTNYDQEAFAETFGDSTVSMLKRKSKFMDIEGVDYSDTLQGSWDDLLISRYDYYQSGIVTVAKRYIKLNLEAERSGEEREYNC